MQQFARKLAMELHEGDCIALEGDVGAGKTFLATHMIRQLCGSNTVVTSPTFTISQYYQPKRNIAKEGLWHYDLYRLEHPQELEETGLRDTLDDAITLIEWPAIANTWLPYQKLHIQIAFDTDARYRNVILSGDHALWKTRLPTLEPRS